MIKIIKKIAMSYQKEPYFGLKYVLYIFLYSLIMNDSLLIAKKVLQTEAKAIAHLIQCLDENFEQAIQCLLQCTGKVIICGMGKSGLVGRKIAATLSSTGTPSIFLHPSEALHGDLGVVGSQDCFISISHSGETDEILQLLPYITSLSIPHIAIVGNASVTLAKQADWVITTAVEEEGNALTIVPFASTMAAMAIGDALAASLLTLRKFTNLDFAQLHKGGNIGHKLLTTVGAIMQTTNLPQTPWNSPIKEVIFEISRSSFGLVVVTDPTKKIQGVITDGDLRRALHQYPNASFFELKANHIMTTTPKTITADTSIWDAEQLFLTLHITALLVVDSEVLVGIIGQYQIK
jgi:arabinose-5-phosphate isomerase